MIFMMDNILMVWNKDMEDIFGWMAIITKDNGRIIFLKEKENMYLKMANIMKGSLKMESVMDMEPYFQRIKLFWIKDIGLKINSNNDI